MKARVDIRNYCNLPQLELKEINAKLMTPNASYTLTKEHIIDVCELVKELKFQNIYVLNISRCVFG